MHRLIRVLARTTLHACLPLALLCGAAHAQSIAPANEIDVAGSHTYTLTGRPSGQVVWTVDRETRSEKGTGEVGVQKKLFRSTGLSATFNLVKVAGQETVYYVRATNGVFSDVRRVQVFESGALSSFFYKDVAHAWVRTYMVVPASLNRASGMLFVMHGSARDALSYCEPWVEWAATHDYIVVCPTFDTRRWPGDYSYNQGAVFRNKTETQLNTEEAWAFSAVQKMQFQLRKQFDLQSPRFDLYGHSAGGQFVTRFMLFRPTAPVRLALPANPGWYLLPKETEAYPCGPAHSQLAFTAQDLRHWTRRNMVIFRGTEDLLKADLDTRGCMEAQGEHRFARAKSFHDAGKAFDPDTTWRLIDVPGIGHDQRGMAPAAQDYIDAYNAAGADPL